ncbi:hypothetical protein KKF91_07795 [Myxococcota bacterium]|nr:hypothetical protein [Myxococcota bacterium]MBU1430446.1 hypothetical protein [Myxococcota bacterium]MBU1896277.1 hypothetical protein [Myxococcota bacterium]
MKRAPSLMFLSLCLWVMPGVAEAGCVGDTKLERYEVAIDPALDCLTVTVAGSECVTGLEITLRSSCQEAIKLDREFEQVEVFTGESRTFDYEEHRSGEEETVVFDFTVGEAAHTLSLTYLARDDTSAYDSCDVGGLGRGRAGWGLLLGILPLGIWAPLRRRRA